jgi:hypothetical protein
MKEQEEDKKWLINFEEDDEKKIFIKTKAGTFARKLSKCKFCK